MNTRPTSLVRIACVGAFLALAWVAMPQATPSPTAAAPMTREERIRQHHEKIQKILEENRRKTAEQEAQKAAAGTPTPAPAAGSAPAPTPPAVGGAPHVVSGTPLPAGPVGTLAPGAPRPGATPPPAAAAASPKGARSESRTIMFFRPFDSTVYVGETFATDVVADSKEGNIDEISFLLRYPKAILNPLAVDHSDITLYSAGEIEYANDPERGELYMRIPLASPQKFVSRPVVRIIWEALKISQGADIEFGSSGDRRTGLYIHGENVLGTFTGTNDGVINATVMVRGITRRENVHKLDDKGLLISTSRDEPPKPNLTYELRTRRESVRAGEEFEVSVVLNNPDDAPFDHVQLYMQFDPADLEVIDSDRGNWIREGTNILDGFAHENFIFDWHRTNSADNKRGIIVYDCAREMDSMRAAGTVARVRFRALRTTSRSDITLVNNGKNGSPTTDVRLTGVSLLANRLEKPTVLSGIAMEVGPALPGYNGERQPQRAAARGLPRTLVVR